MCLRQEKFVRAAGLTFGFLSVGVIAVTFMPTFLAQITRTALPAWFLTKQVATHTTRRFREGNFF